MEEGKGILASDSTDIETDRYSYEIRPVKYLTWHVTPAIIDHLIILNIHVLQARKLMILQYAEQNSIC